MKVVVNKCRFTGKIFEQKDHKKYLAHLKKVRADLAHKRKVVATKKTFKDWLDNERAQIKYARDIPEWFLKNQRTIMDGVNAGFGREWRDDRFYTTDEFTKCQFRHLTFTQSASNTHVCPHNGITNWWCEAGKPTGYIGWVGAIEGTLRRDKAHAGSYPYSSALNAVGIRTGSGGGGNGNWGYSCTIFVADWPGLQYEIDEIEQQQIVNRLMGVK